MSEAPESPRRTATVTRSRRRRVLRWVGRGVLALVCLVAILVLAFAFIAPLRTSLLERALTQVRASLPGTLDLRASWPSLGTLVIEDLVWRDEADTLATITSLRLDVDLTAAIGKRMRVEEMLLHGAFVDVDAVLARTASADSTTALADSTAEKRAGVAVPWFRTGRFRSLPHAVLEKLELHDVRAVQGGQTYALRAFDAHVDLGEGASAPWLDLDLRAEAPGLASVRWRAQASRQDSLVVRVARVHVDREALAPPPRPLEFEGAIVAANESVDDLLAGRPVAVRWTDVRMTGDAGDLLTEGDWDGERVRVRLDFIAPERTELLAEALALASIDTLDAVQRVLLTWPDEDPYTLDLLGEGKADDFSFTGSISLPGPTSIVDPAALPFALGDYARLAGTLALRGTGPEDLTVDLDLHESPWLRRARVSAHWDGESAQIDTLDIERQGLTLVARGRASEKEVDARLSFAIDSDALDGVISKPAESDSTLRFAGSGEATLKGFWPLPQVDMKMRGSASGSFGEVSDASLRVIQTQDRSELRLQLGQPATISGRRIEGAEVRWDGVVDLEREAIDGRAIVDLRGEDVFLALSTNVAARLGAHVDATVDSLRFGAAGTTWRSQGRFGVGVDSTGVLVVDGLELRGNAGRLSLSTVSSAESTRTELESDLMLSRAWLSTVLPDSLHSMIPADSTKIALRARLAGLLREPSAEVDLDVSLLGAERFAPFSLAANLWMRGDTKMARSDSVPDLPSRGAVLELTLDHADQRWLSTRAVAAGRLNLIEGTLQRAPRDTATVELQAEAVDLEQLLALLPSPPEVKGLFEGTVRLAVTDRDVDADVDLRVDGVTLRQPDGNEWKRDVRLVARGGGNLEREFLLEELLVDTGTGALHGRGTVREEVIDLELEGAFQVGAQLLTALMPPEMTYEVPADSVRVGFELAVAGPLAGPSAHAGWRLGLRGGDQLPPLDFNGNVWLRGQAELPGSVVPPDDLPRSGVVTRFALSQEGAKWFDAEGVFPLRFGLSPALLEPVEGEPLRVRLDTAKLDVARVATLADLDRLGRFSGDVDIDIALVSEDGRTAKLEGSIISRKLRADLVDGSWVEAKADVGFGGTSESPTVDGGVTVVGGVIRIPDLQASLHETEGEALLWTESATASVESVGVQPSEVQDPVKTEPGVKPKPRGSLLAQTGAQSIVPKLDVGLDIPGTLRLTGKGLDIELSGDLDVRSLDEGELGVVGTLLATRGSYQFLGRRFEIRTGRVSFSGDLDPELELRLATKLESNTYFVEITGTAQQQKFALSAEPAASEADIVSALLFGRPVDELDEGQSGLLVERTQEVAAQLGTNLLAQRIGQQLGLDAISVQPASSGSGQSLVVGKYIDPKVLVQYEQVLERGQASLVRIEYALTRMLKIETTGSLGSQSGIDLKWSKDY